MMTEADIEPKNGIKEVSPATLANLASLECEKTGIFSSVPLSQQAEALIAAGKTSLPIARFIKDEQLDPFNPQKSAERDTENLRNAGEGYTLALVGDLVRSFQEVRPSVLDSVQVYCKMSNEQASHYPTVKPPAATPPTGPADGHPQKGYVK